MSESRPKPTASSHRETSTESRWECMLRGVLQFMQTPISWTSPKARMSKRRRKELEKRRRHHPYEESTLLALVRAYDGLDDTNLALNVFCDLVELYCAQDYPVKALAILRRMIELDPSCLVSRRILAETLERLDRLREASEAYLAAAKVAEADSHLEAATFLRQQAQAVRPLSSLSLSRSASAVLTTPTPTPSDECPVAGSHDAIAVARSNIATVDPQQFEDRPDTFKRLNLDAEQSIVGDDPSEAITKRLGRQTMKQVRHQINTWESKEQKSTADLRPPKTPKRSISSDTIPQRARRASTDTQPLARTT